jgi:hypothetical protein
MVMGTAGTAVGAGVSGAALISRGTAVDVSKASADRS